MPSAVTGFLCLAVLIPLGLSAQTEPVQDSLQKQISAKLSDKYINEVGSRSAELSSKLNTNTEVYLNKLKSQEELIKKKLSILDSNTAKRIFSNSSEEYNKIQNELRTNSQNILKGCGKYLPGIDTAITSLKFLQQASSLSKVSGNASQVQNALSKVQSLEDQFKKADNVEDFIRQRENYLQQQLSSYNLTGLQKYQQIAVYYAQSVNQLKEDWNDPSKVEGKAISALEKIPAFQKFMEKYSMLAGLFNIPEDYGSTGIAEGMQTKDAIQKLMNQQMTLMGPNGAQTAQANILDAQSQLSSLRNKIQQLGSGGGDLAMPDFNPNQQKTKTFLKRIEYGVDIQNTRATGLLPTTTVFAVTAGYKLNEKSTAGIRLSYNVGWGSDIQHIHISSQGIGLGSFMDVKLKANFYATGGYEKSYNKVFTSISQIESGNLWQTSGLIGISKIVSLRGNLVKKTKLQLLWNFLSYSQLPKMQPLVFRLGYNF